MPFDKIITNPPYNKNLHLKILREAMKHSDEIVNLSPIRWLQDPLAEYKRGSDWKKFGDIREKIIDITPIKAAEANDLFGIGLYADLGIYYFNEKAPNRLATHLFWKQFKTKAEIIMIEKLMKMKDSLKNHIDKNKIDGIRVPLTLIGGNRGYKPVYKDIAFAIDGKDCNTGNWWTEAKNMGGYEKPEGSAFPLSVKFNSENEANNFYQFWFTKFGSWICEITHCQQHIQENMLPFLPNYKKPWTDADLYEYFSLTPEEIKEIENHEEISCVFPEPCHGPFHVRL